MTHLHLLVITQSEDGRINLSCGWCGWYTVIDCPQCDPAKQKRVFIADGPEDYQRATELLGGTSDREAGVIYSLPYLTCPKCGRKELELFSAPQCTFAACANCTENELWHEMTRSDWEALERRPSIGLPKKV